MKENNNRFDIEETPELVARALREMDDAINDIPFHDKPAHARAIELHNNSYLHCSNNEYNNNRCYVQTEYFRLRFLRVERYDARKAAKRYCLNLNVLHRHYGDVALTRQLRVSDLTEAELKFFKDGIIQMLPSRDSAGRRMFFSFHW